MKHLVVATGNQHKLQELKVMLGAVSSRFKLLSLCDFASMPAPVEDASTFEGNAAIKALAANAHTGQLALGDDSGIVVDALKGAPGIYSARYAGEGATDQQNLQLLLEHMDGVLNRKAKFVCVLALAEKEKIVATFRGEVAGTLLTHPTGDHGFGYDPIFVPEHQIDSFAQLPTHVKNLLSHRARAVEKLRCFLDTFSI